MYGKGRKKNTIRFTIKPGGEVSQVQVATDVGNWEAVPMKKQKDGSFVRNVPLAVEACEYKFILDGQWATDPDNDRFVPNAYGTFNSVAELA